MMKNAEDEHWMLEALKEGRKGLGLTAPNPAVGAIIVRDGIELARGWHREAGTDHAEKDALSKISGARGATLYVTLEPCSTHGTTGACSEAIIEAGISRVVYGAQDPNPNHEGRADRVLRVAGIAVESGICREACEGLICAFAKVQKTGLPWVIGKTAMSLDGRITRPPKESQWLTSPEAREEVQLLRAEVDAILTSGETVRKDNPALTLRSGAISSQKKQPLRVVLTRQGLARSTYQIFQDGHRTRLFEKRAIKDVLRILVEEEAVHSVLVESGGTLMGAFLDEGLIDELVVYLAPIVVGGSSTAVAGKGIGQLKNRLSLVDPEIRRVGPDLVARGRVGKIEGKLARKA